MPKMFPVHYQTEPGPAHCGATIADPGTELVIGTNDPAETTCAKCLMKLPITEAEHAEIVDGARS